MHTLNKSYKNGKMLLTIYTICVYKKHTHEKHRYFSKNI